MDEKNVIAIVSGMVPKRAKMVDGRYKGGFPDWESKEGEAIKIAISALQKQIPKSRGCVTDSDSVTCGNCRSDIDTECGDFQ